MHWSHSRHTKYCFSKHAWMKEEGWSSSSVLPCGRVEGLRNQSLVFDEKLDIRQLKVARFWDRYLQITHSFLFLPKTAWKWNSLWREEFFSASFKAEGRPLGFLFRSPLKSEPYFLVHRAAVAAIATAFYLPIWQFYRRATRQTGKVWAAAIRSELSELNSMDNFHLKPCSRYSYMRVCTIWVCGKMVWTIGC